MRRAGRYEDAGKNDRREGPLGRQVLKRLDSVTKK